MRVLAHDYETTGVDAKTCGVVQSAIALVDIDDEGNWNVVAQETAYHHPGMPIPAGASKVHGVYDKDVQSLPHFEEGLALTFAQAEEEFGYEAVLGYNSNRFDNVIARRVGLKEDYLAIDLMTAANRLLNQGVITRARLVDAYEQLVGKSADNAHDALADILMTLELIKPVMTETKIETFPEFVEWLNKPMTNTKMRIPFGKHKGEALENVPRSYLRWLSRKGDLQVDLQLSIEAALK